jgi:hypothetical protein
VACADIVWKVKLTPVQLECAAALALAAVATFGLRELVALAALPRPVAAFLVAASVLPAAVRRLSPLAALTVVTLIGLAVFAVTRLGGVRAEGSDALASLAENALIVAGSWVMGDRLPGRAAARLRPDSGTGRPNATTGSGSPANCMTWSRTASA